MNYVLYEILLHFTFLIFSPYFLLKMCMKYREGIFERLGVVSKEKIKGLNNKKVLWIHAVSVGETMAVMPVVRLIKKKRPELKLLFSTTTKTGQAVAKKEGKGLIDALIYLPFDFSWAVRPIIKNARPLAFATVEKDIWPNLFRAFKQRGIPIMVVNGNLSDRSYKRYRILKFFFKEVFGSVAYYCGQTEKDRQRAVELGVAADRAMATGNIKFDLKPADRDKGHAGPLKDALGINYAERIIVAGSTHKGEEEAMLNAFKTLKHESGDSIKLIIAPRHPERFSEVQAAIEKAGFKPARRSRSEKGPVIMLDTIGELLTAYSFADVAFVGGSLIAGIGGHNLLEPAFFGKPVLYGPYLGAYEQMAGMLEAKGAGFLVRDEKGVYEAIKALLKDEKLREKAGAAAKKVVEENSGASEKTVKLIEGFLR